MINVENEEKRRRTLQMTINTIIPMGSSRLVGEMESGIEREATPNIEKTIEMKSEINES